MSKLTLLLILSAYIIYFLITPPLTIHDEPAHIKIIAGVAQGKYLTLGQSVTESKELQFNKRLEQSLKYEDHPYQIPTFSNVSFLKANAFDYAINGIYSHQSYSPPLYYFMGAAFYYIAQLVPNLLGQFYILRLTSALFYFCTVFLSWKILQLFFKNNYVANALLIFFSLNPIVLKMGIGINPDIGVTFFSLAFLYYLLLFFPSGFSVKKITAIGILSGFATLTKISGIFTNATFVIFTLLFSGFRTVSLKMILLFEVVFGIVTFSWFWFSLKTYNTFFPQPFTEGCIPLHYHSPILKFAETFWVFRTTIMNYAGFMGEGWPFPFKWFFVSYVILFSFFSLIGLVYVLRQKQIIYKTSLIFITPLLLLLILQSAFYEIKNIDCPIQGRYILPIFMILTIYVYWGVMMLVKKEIVAAKILQGFAIFQYLFILFTVLLIRYYV